MQANHHMKNYLKVLIDYYQKPNCYKNRHFNFTVSLFLHPLEPPALILTQITRLKRPKINISHSSFISTLKITHISRVLLKKQKERLENVKSLHFLSHWLMNRTAARHIKNQRGLKFLRFSLVLIRSRDSKCRAKSLAIGGGTPVSNPDRRISSRRHRQQSTVQ